MAESMQTQFKVEKIMQWMRAHHNYFFSVLPEQLVWETISNKSTQVRMKAAACHIVNPDSVFHRKSGVNQILRGTKLPMVVIRSVRDFLDVIGAQNLISHSRPASGALPRQSMVQSSQNRASLGYLSGLRKVCAVYGALYGG
jgi:hypothetical protein